MNTERSSKGQIMPLMLFALSVSAILMVIMFNMNQKVTDKTVSINASDAAAYSGGVWVARNLNLLAYTNRAMIANHVGVGHMVAYVSWTRYVESTSGNLNKIARFVPYLNVVMNYVKTYSEYVREGAEYAAEGLIPAADYLNRGIAASQYGAVADLNPSKVNAVMSMVLKEHDSNLRFNRVGDLNGTAGAIYQPLIAAEITAYTRALLGSVQILRPGRDQDEMQHMVNKSFGGSKRWLTNRNWTESLLGLFKLRKKFTNSQTLDSYDSDWKSTDRLDYGKWTPKGWDWTKIGKGDATASEFNENYQGILSYAKKKNSAPKNLFFDLVVLSTKLENQIIPNDRMGIDSTGGVISSISKARVYYERPEDGFSVISGEEYSNIYNPFWKVRLVEAL
jgi:hypothetical protein